MGYTLSRQRDGLHGPLYVEIATAKKFVGEDVLAKATDPELKTFTDPRDAVRLAVDVVYKQWNLRYTDEDKQLKIANGVKPLIFSFTKKDITKAYAWADKEFSSMEKCGGCQLPMGSRERHSSDAMPNVICCSTACVAKKYRDMFGTEIPNDKIKATGKKTNGVGLFRSVKSSGKP